MNRIQISYELTFKFLGLIFDSKLTSVLHIEWLPRRYKQIMNIMKFLSSIEWDADHNTIALQLHYTKI